MKTVYITICKDAMYRNIIETDFWNLFIDSIELKVVFLVEKGKFEYYKEKHEGDNVEVIEISPKFITKLQHVIVSFLKLAIKTESVRFYIMRAKADRDISGLSAVIKVGLSAILGNSVLYKRILRKIFILAPTSPEITAIFDKYPPDLVFATSAIDFAFDGIVMAEAKRRKVHVVAMTRSWDNLTSHGLLASVPDTFIFQNIFLKEMADKHQDIPKIDKNQIIGLPHYDIYKNAGSLIEDREHFFRRVGLDPSKKFIFYIGSDSHRSEHIFPEMFEEILSSNDLKISSQMIYRPHPSSAVCTDMLYSLKNVFLDDVFGKRQAGNIKNFDTSHYINCLRYADVVVNAGSTGSIDSASFGKPIICLNFDGDVTLPYWLQSGRMYDQWTHYINLLKTGAVDVVESREQLIECLNICLLDPRRRENGRNKLLALFVKPYDGGASKRLAMLLHKEIEANTET